MQKICEICEKEYESTGNKITRRKMLQMWL